MTASGAPSVALLVFCGFLAFARASLAQTSAELAAADAAFDDALRLMDQGEFAAACPKLERSQKLAPASGTLLNLGECYERLGRLASAWTHFSRAAALAQATGKPERAEVALRRAEALQSRVALLTFSAPERPIAGLELFLDGVPVPSAEWGTAIAVTPGEHTLRASAPEREPFQAPLWNANAGSSLTLQVPELRPLTAPTPLESRAASGLDAQGVAAVVAAGVGVTGVVAGALFGLHSQSKHDESDRYCDGNLCGDARGVTAMEAARSAGNRSTASFILGGLGLGTAAVFWFVRPFGPTPQSTARVGLGPLALEVRGSW